MFVFHAEVLPTLQSQDSMLKTWGWENGKLCAYKDDQLQPISITKVAIRTDWSIASACAASPNSFNSARDNLNRLWGWENNRCVNACSHVLVFYMLLLPGWV